MNQPNAQQRSEYVKIVPLGMACDHVAEKSCKNRPTHSVEGPDGLRRFSCTNHIAYIIAQFRIEAAAEQAQVD